MIQNKTNENILIFVLLAMIAFVLLKPGLLSLTLPVLLFCTVISFINKNSNIKEFVKNKFWIMSLFLPLIYLSGVFTSNYPEKASFEIIQKLSVPLIGFLIVSPISDKKRFFRLIEVFYPWIISFCLLFNAALSFIEFIKNGSVDSFLYKNFSGANHPGYYSMFVVMSLAISLNNLGEIQANMKKLLLHLIPIFITIAGLFLLSSKTGLITMIILWCYFGIQFIYRKVSGNKYYLFLRYLIPVIIVLFTTIILKSDRFYVAALGLKNIHEKPIDELGTAGQRILIWETISELVPTYWISGTGVGNDQKILNDKYHEKGLLYFEEKSLNAHNQFLQALLIFGVGGFLFFLIYLLLPLLTGIMYRDTYLILFGVIVLINALTESILNRQAGILFWTFWAFLLFAGRSIQKEKS